MPRTYRGTERIAYAQGVQAGLAGQGPNVNPYKADDHSEQARAWETGWWDGDETRDRKARKATARRTN